MIKTRQQIQSEAEEAWNNNGCIGCVVLSTGSGKSKVAIDIIKHGNYKNILITSPRTNLKENWKKELLKWLKTFRIRVEKGYECFGQVSEFMSNGPIITIENIQTVYKWSIETIKQFDLIIFDEIHTIVTPEYGRLIYNATCLNIHRLGLTATPDKDGKFDHVSNDYLADWKNKEDFYNFVCPIIYEYYDSAEDGLVNKRKYIIYKYNLTDDYSVIAGTKKSQFTVGEATQYDYLTEQIRKGQKLMAQTGSEDWFRDAGDWFWKGLGDSVQKNAAMIYLNAIKYRKEFLWKLSSSADIALQIKHKIFENSSSNKVLLFSELTSQANKLSAYSVHSKQDDDTNKKLIKMFDSGEIKELSSVRSLTLGLNLVGAKYGIMESYNSSNTGIIQKMGRLDRLEVDDISTIIAIVPLQTQAEEWFNKAIKGIDLTNALIIDNINDLKL